ncbi:MAG: hypothetical protein V7721_02060 [Porticoccaceae bacterium]
MELFQNSDSATNRIYKNVRDSDTPMMVCARELCLDLWKRYEQYADENFVTEIQRDFSARFWEMDLTCLLIDLAKDVACPKPGPDIKVDETVWVEAISPSQGADGSPDRVPDIVTGIASSIDSDLITLRYTAAIEEKHRKYLGYIEAGIIKESEPYIIALNSSQIPAASLELPMPRIVSAVLSIGSQYVEFDRKSGDIVGGGFHHKESVRKKSGSDVPIDMFHNPNYAGISAVLYSGTDSCNRPEKNGSGYILVHNPLAKNPIGTGFLGVGKEAIIVIENETDYTISWVNHESA